MAIKLKNITPSIYTRTQNARSAWDRGVARYALDLINSLEERDIHEIAPNSPLFLKQCLNGADDWRQYSNGGCSLICDCEIVERLATDSEKRRYNAGRLERPNARESWLDCQARALFQAFRLIQETAATHAITADATRKSA